MPETIRLVMSMIGQTAMLAFGQVFLKMGMTRMTQFSWSWHFWGPQFLLNGWLQLALLLIVGCNVWWLWLIKIYPFSVVYPMTSLGFVFGMLAGMWLLGESVCWTQWIGVVLILAGCYFIVK